MKTKVKLTIEKEEIAQPTQEEMMLSINEMESFLDRMPGMPWVFSDVTAEEIKEGKFLSNPLHLEINKQELTKERRDVFNTYWDEFLFANDTYKGKFLHANVIIKLTDIKSFDTLQYEYTHFKVTQ